MSARRNRSIHRFFLVAQTPYVYSQGGAIDLKHHAVSLRAEDQPFNREAIGQ